MTKDPGNPDTAAAPSAEIVAVGDSAATLVSQGAKIIRDHAKLQKRDTLLLKSLADVIIRLRMCYHDADGRVDLTGRSHAYKEAAQRMYERSGIPVDRVRHTQSAVRYHVNNRLHEHMRDEGFTDADYAHYGLLKTSNMERVAARRAMTREELLAAREEREARSGGEAPAASAAAAQADLGELMGIGESPDPQAVADRITRRLREVSDLAAEPSTESALTRMKAADRKKLKQELDAADETNAALRSYL